MELGKCKLCNQVRKLADSHIIPEFCYSPVYNQNHKMLGITGIPPKNSKPVQKGIKEYLLCADCEEYRNREIEQPYQFEWNRTGITSGKFLPGTTVKFIFDFEVFRKFHLSILFLASVAKNDTWSEVSLGPHEEALRRYINNQIDLPSWQYPIAGVITVQNDGTLENRFVLSPSKSKLFKSTYYGLTFCGVRWGYFVSSHANQELLAACIRPSGDLTMEAELWTEFQSMRDLGITLNRNKP